MGWEVFNVHVDSKQKRQVEMLRWSICLWQVKSHVTSWDMVPLRIDLWCYFEVSLFIKQNKDLLQTTGLLRAKRSFWMKMVWGKCDLRADLQRSKRKCQKPTFSAHLRRNSIKFLSNITLHFAWPCQYETWRSIKPQKRRMFLPRCRRSHRCQANPNSRGEFNRTPLWRAAYSILAAGFALDLWNWGSCDGE